MSCRITYGISRLRDGKGRVTPAGVSINKGFNATRQEVGFGDSKGRTSLSVWHDECVCSAVFLCSERRVGGLSLGYQIVSSCELAPCTQWEVGDRLPISGVTT